MKKVVLFLFLSLSVLLISARPFDKKHMLGVTGSLEYSYRYLSSDADLSWLEDLRNKNENPILGFSAAFHTQMRVWKKLYVDFSFALIRKGYSTDRDSLVYNQQEPGAPVDLHYRYTTGCLELPINFNFHPIDSGAFFISLGIAPVIPLIESRRTFLGYADGSTKTESDASFGSGSFSISASAGIGYYFNLGKKTLLQVKPFYRANITDGNEKNLKEYYYSFGIDLGVFFSR